jgi:hypothetical protein
MKERTVIATRIVNPLASVLIRVAIAATLFLGFTGLAVAGDDNDRCSNRTLKGDYAFTISGQALNPNGSPSATKGIAMTTFDGGGKLTQIDFVVNDGKISSGSGDSMNGFHFQTGETGTYVVNPDCTGSAEIDLNVPVPQGSSGVIKLMLVLSNRGRAIHTVVAEFTPPGASGPAPVTTSSDGFKVGGDR